MKTSSLLIDIILLAVIIVPITFLIVYSARSEKKIKAKITKLCKSNGITLDTFAIEGNAILGLDLGSKKLITSSRQQIENDFQIIDIPSLKECTVKTIKLSKNTTDWVGLELIGLTSHKGIPFYVEDDETSPATDAQICLQQAKEWEKRIKPLLKVS